MVVSTDEAAHHAGAGRRAGIWMAMSRIFVSNVRLRYRSTSIFFEANSFSTARRFAWFRLEPEKTLEIPSL